MEPTTTERNALVMVRGHSFVADARLYPNDGEYELRVTPAVGFTQATHFDTLERKLDSRDLEFAGVEREYETGDVEFVYR